MKPYRMEIFGLPEGRLESVLRERHDICAPDDTVAVAKAKALYRDLAQRLNFTNFSLYDARGRLVCEPTRKDPQISRGSRKRPEN